MAKQTKAITHSGVDIFCHHRNLPVVIEGPASSAAKKLDSAPVSEWHFSQLP